MINNEILEEYFIWDERSLTEHQMNCENSVNSEINDTTNNTKINSTQIDWRDITDPKLRKKLRKKAWRKANEEKLKKQNKAYYEANKDKNREYRKDYNKAYKKANKEKQKAYSKAYRDANRDKRKTYLEANKDKRNKHRRNRKKTDIQYKLSNNLRSRLRDAIRCNYKSGSAVKDLGCSIEELKVYLESKFLPGMTWDNYGLYGWHIDHIKPLASFDLSDRNQLLEACHYTNLQPLWANDNLSKGDKFIKNPLQPLDFGTSSGKVVPTADKARVGYQGLRLFR